MYDALELTKVVRKEVCKCWQGKFLAKYYRFRATRFYGGCATADISGCNLRCGYCWSSNVVWRNLGKFCEPEFVAQRLNEIALRNGFRYCRISGGEPTICKEHLLEVIKRINRGLIFILETNGILLGEDESFVVKLREFPNLHVRVSLKGANEEMFSKVTKAHPENFRLQLAALRHLKRWKISFHPAILIDLYTEGLLEELKQRLAEIDRTLPARLDHEFLIKFPHVVKRMKEYGLLP
ncbi:MAG: radical SAM protein [Candidatus Nanoarchaeia archaeon]|nr:radical SAM protein [Candidatus Haiyanarchaeum thermophilum]MCW1302804.1 radical SAM protein [Candidatus Haiyanarchaeum thermophilum]MCW1303485.1 radical SAM protein [Candidatus Haiyanarchaeum thermophilum]MCW1306665.1 radical SAM protein [Candidatus Haiyanarchaeum thermophilum]MCW1307379.1 radical SAM protein [Candidatus Haiyanarchaeum thermophilum]